MQIPFVKYHGAGNDFILIDDRFHDYSLSEDQIERLCNRYFGIGADGLIMLKSSDEYDFTMQYFNSDGKESSFCGNGGRCLVHFANSLNLFSKTTRFQASDGIHHGTVLDTGWIELTMKDVNPCISYQTGNFLNTGSPHFILQVNDLQSTDVVSLGRMYRNDQSLSSEGVNVNFVEVLSDDKIAVRTFERGVENETLACGTGVTASALALVKNKAAGDYSINVQVKGGSLTVLFTYLPESEIPYLNIRLLGPAQKVFDGRFELH
jgi:diaminopimelate epimerase